MDLHWIDIAFIAAMVTAGSGVIYFVLMRRFERALGASQRDLDRRLAALTEQITIRELDADDTAESSCGIATSEQQVPAVERSQPVVPPQVDHASAANLTPGFCHDSEELPPEIQVAITAAAIAVFGNHARVRSARRVPSSDVVSPWTQQGRVIVQSSHNLRMRG